MKRRRSGENVKVQTSEDRNRLESREVCNNKRPKTIKSDARAAVMDDGEPIETDQRRRNTEGEADLTTIDSWADVLLEKDLMLIGVPECSEIDDF